MTRPDDPNDRNRYASGEEPKPGDVVDSDSSKMLVLAVEPIPDQDRDRGFASVCLRGVPPEVPPPWGTGKGWMPDKGPEHRNQWLPWRCRLVRRDALGELTSKDRGRS